MANRTNPRRGKSSGNQNNLLLSWGTEHVVNANGIIAHSAPLWQLALANQGDFVVPINELKDSAKQRAFMEHGLIRCPLCQDLARPFGKLMPDRLYVCDLCTTKRDPKPKSEIAAESAHQWLFEYLIQNSELGEFRNRDIHKVCPFSNDAINMAFSRLRKQGHVARVRIGSYELLVNDQADRAE